MSLLWGSLLNNKWLIDLIFYFLNCFNFFSLKYYLMIHYYYFINQNYNKNLFIIIILSAFRYINFFIGFCFFSHRLYLFIAKTYWKNFGANFFFFFSLATVDLSDFYPFLDCFYDVCRSRRGLNLSLKNFTIVWWWEVASFDGYISDDDEAWST